MSIKRPFIWAHRGASGYATGNTMESFEKARELGADGIETDVFSTKDGQVVVSHNGSVMVEGQKVSISSVTLAELRQLPQDMSIPTFSELLDFTLPHKMPVSIDVRNIDNVRDLIAILETRQAFSTVEICLDSLYNLKKARGLSSAVVLIFSPSLDWAPSRVVKLLDQHLPTFEELGLKAINFWWKFYVDHPELIYTIHKEGKMRAYTWDVHLKSVMQKVIPLNLDAIYTNFPDRLRALYEGNNQ